MIPKKRFGRTGHESTRTLFGAAALAEVTQKEADLTLELLLKYNINHIDTAATYGESELRIGPWMREYRKKFFLATKTEQRTYQEAKDELHRSLDRLKVDHVDLWQMHVLVNEAQWETAMHSGGAIDAFIEAKEEGLVSFLGVTGHGLAAAKMHLKSLEVHDFDAVLLPYNFILMQNPEYAKDFNKLVKICEEKNIALQTIKSLARGPLDGKMNTHTTWYDPIVEDDAINHSVSWVLGNENVFLNTINDIHLLKKVLKAAENFDIKPSTKIMLQDVKTFGITQLFTSAEI
jgi:aryl-alcohol dehydrogenase-like predicted oxidoreductase